MDFFAKARVVRLKSVHNLYLTADEDETDVLQLREEDSSARQTQWTVHCILDNEGQEQIRLLSCYNRCLMATKVFSFIGLAGLKVHQAFDSPDNIDTFWLPTPAGSANRFSLRSRCGLLRANRRTNSASCAFTETYDQLMAAMRPQYFVWDVEIVEANKKGLPEMSPLQIREANKKVEEDGTAAKDHGQGQYIIRFTVTDNLSNVSEESSKWFSFTHSNGPAGLLASLKEQTQFDEILVFTWNPENEFILPFDEGSLPPGGNMISLIVANAESNSYLNMLVKSRLSKRSRKEGNCPSNEAMLADP